MNRLPFRLVVALSVLLPILASCSPLFDSRESSSGSGNPGGGGPGGDNGGGVTYTLTVTFDEDKGTVSVSPDKTVYNSGELITITATPEEGFFLSHWGGDAEGRLENPLVLAIDGNKAITAVFSPDLWTRATDAAGWPARKGHAVVSFDNKLWVMGGDSGGSLNDVWSSSDGEAWAQVEPIGGEIWSGRMGHGAVVHDGSIWVIGGAHLNDVWRSSDAENWTEVTVTHPWSARNEFLALSHDNALWVMGGLDDEGTVLNDIWSSSNGVTWEKIEPEGDIIWSPRRGHVGVVFKGKLWVIGGIGAGGTLLSDVWSSSDGVTWTPATADAGWPVRSGHAAAVHEGKIWLFGGQSSSQGSAVRRYRDVWSSANGITWTPEPHGSWSPRYKHRALSHNNRLWMIGGGEQWPPAGVPAKTNDVWYLELPSEE